MDTACREWEGGKVKFRFMCGIHDRAVGIRDGDWTGRGPLVDDGS